MASSVVYSSIFAAVRASIPGLSTKLICFDISIIDFTDHLADPVEVLFGVQLGGGTDINAALTYCERQIENPAKTHLVLITDLYEGGDANSLLARASASKQSGVNLIVLLALSDAGHPAYEPKHAGALASFACPVFACTPDQFPSMMAAALTGKDLHTGVRTKRRSHPGILRASGTYLEEKWTCLLGQKIKTARPSLVKLPLGVVDTSPRLRISALVPAEHAQGA